MRILEIVHGFPPAALGGTELYAQSHAQALRDGGDDVLVLAREDDSSRDEYAVRTEFRNGLRIILVNNTFRTTRSFEDTYRNETIGAIADRVIDDFKPHVAHIHHLTGLSTTIVRSLAHRRIPSVLTLHDYWLICHRGQLLDTDYRICDGPGVEGCHACLPDSGGTGAAAFAGAVVVRALERRLSAPAARQMRGLTHRVAGMVSSPAVAENEERKRIAHMRGVCGEVTHFLAPSRFIRDRFVQFGVAPERITVSGNGWSPALGGSLLRKPDPTAPDPTPSDPTPLRGVLRLGFLGTLMISKAPHLLLEAAARLPRGAVSVDLFGGYGAYHGDDGYRQKLEPLLSRAGVHAHGVVPHDQAAKALASVDVLVVPSIWPENAPLVIQEAFLAGRPVVASRIGGIPEMVTHGENGLLFRPGDVDDLSTTLARLTAEPELLDTLRAGIPSVRSIDDDVASARGLYERLSARSPVHGNRIAAVVLNHRTPDETLLAVKSLLASRHPIDDVIVVNNDVNDETRAKLNDVWTKIAYLHTGRNLGFSGGTNVGIREALARGADSILLVNSDVIVPPDTIEQLKRQLDEAPLAGIAGPIVLARSEPDQIASLGMSYAPATGRMRHRGYGVRLGAEALPTGGPAVDGVSGCLMLVRRQVFEAVGLFDEAYFFSFEDLDFCLRAGRAGFATVLVREAAVYHEGGQSLGATSPRRFYFAARNHLLLARRADPTAGPIRSGLRVFSIVTLNLVHAVMSPGGTLIARLSAFAHGLCDYVSGRFGSESETHSRLL